MGDPGRGLMHGLGARGQEDCRGEEGRTWTERSEQGQRAYMEDKGGLGKRAGDAGVCVCAQGDTVHVDFLAKGRLYPRATTSKGGWREGHGRR